MTRFVVCGEALIDLIPDGPGDTLATPWRALSAGGPMNSAIALARLGHDVQFLGRLGSDGFARQIQSHLEANGVGLDLAVHADEATSLAVVSLDDEGHASYTFHFAGTANFGWQPDELAGVADADAHPDADTVLHIASLATIVEPGASVLRAWVASLPGTVSFDVNVRPTVITDPAEYWRRVEPWLEVLGARGILKASDEDLGFLAEAAGLPTDLEQMLPEIGRRHGIRRIIVTRGPDGVLGLDGDRLLVEPGRPVDVVDTVGAGDTFMAGFLSHLADAPDDVAGALAWGVGASAIVCSRRGANPPTGAELAAAMG